MSMALNELEQKRCERAMGALLERRRPPAEKEDYFHHFLENRPSGTIDLRTIELGCNTAVDAGLYTFTFAKTGAKVSGRYTYTYRWNGSEWLITSHHSSAMPEKE